jgi:hypothetical protein
MANSRGWTELDGNDPLVIEQVNVPLEEAATDLTSVESDVAAVATDLENALAPWADVARRYASMLASNFTADRYAFLGSSSDIAAPAVASGGTHTLTGSAIRGTPITFDPADYAVSGRTTTIRILGRVITMDTAPARDFTFILYPLVIASGASQVSVTFGTQVVSAAVLSPAATAIASRVVSATVAAPAAGLYALACNVNGAMAASSVVAVEAALQIRTA